MYSDDIETREPVKEFLDRQGEIVNWRYDLPNCFYLVSPNSAQLIGDPSA